MMADGRMNEPIKTPFDAFLDAFRQVVREEIAAAMNGREQPKLKGLASR